MPSRLRVSVRQRAALGLMLASGFAGLGYQIVWTQQAAVWLGHEAAAVLAVVTAFFGGLATGALLAGPRIERSKRPERWYAACEASMAVWGLVLALWMTPVSSAMLAAIGPQPSPLWHWSVAFIGTFFLLLPATAAMGATLPAMDRVLGHWAAADRPGPAGSVAQPRAVMKGDAGPSKRRDANLAALYAANTLGAVLGVLAAAFWLVPEIGLVRTAVLCAALNLGCATAVLLLGRRRAVRTTPPAPATRPAAMAAAASETVAAARPSTSARALWVLAATGLLGIGYEVLVVRVISQVTENTVYTFALLLAVYLVGTAAGAAACARGWLGQAEDSAVRDRLLSGLAAACLLGAGSLWAAEGVRDAVLQALGPGMAKALVAEALLALAAFALPTFVMGALFSHLCMQHRSAAANDGAGLGRALGVNTLGAAAAPALFGVLLLPAWGAKLALLVVAGGYLALTTPRGWRWPGAWASALALAAMALWAPPLVFVEVPEGGQVLSYREGAIAAVSVVQDSAGVARLRIDNRQQEGSSATQFADARQALLPLLLHPQPQRALFLGLGTGNTASAAAADPGLRVDAVELLPEVIEAAALFNPVLMGKDAQSTSRLHLLAADARRFVRAGGPSYDVIVSDNFHPARSGSASLYTVEHFQAVRDRLAPGGVFCQWLPLHQLDLATLRSIVRAYRVAYPDSWALLATHSLDTPVLGLVARVGAGRFELHSLRQRLAGQQLARPLADFGIPNELALLGGFVAGPRALEQFAGQAPLNTDDRPVVAYRAPRITYAPDSLPRERLLALLNELALAPEELLDARADPALAPRLAAYWAARNQYLVSGLAVRPSTDVRTMLQQVREPLLSVLRTSPDFRPAYDPLLRMAVALSRSDASGAHALLSELAQTQPARPEAAQALQQLSRPAP